MFTIFNQCNLHPTLTCDSTGAHAQALLGPTGTQGCTQPGHCLGPTGTQGCTMPPHCVPNTIGCTAITPCATTVAQAQVGPTGTHGCTIVGPTGTHGCTIVGPTGTQGCTIVGPTGTQGCTIVGPTGTQGCTMPPHCVPNTIGCTAITPCATTPAPQVVGPTGTQGCTMPPHCVPNTVGCTAITPCVTIPPQTAPPHCVPNTVGCTAITPCATTIGGNAQAQVGPTGTQGCTMPPHCVPNTIGCTGITPCKTINTPNCGHAQAQIDGPTGWLGCTVPPNCFGPTGTHGCTVPTGTPPATVCPQPTHLIGCTGYQGCVTGSPAATVCQEGVANANIQTTIFATGSLACKVVGPTGTQGCTMPPHCVPETIGCTAITPCATTVVGNAQAQNLGPTGTQGCTQPGHCVGQTGWLGCHQQETIATVCTQIGCEPTHLLGCTGYEGCHQPTGTPPETICPQGDADPQTLGHTAYEGCGHHGTEATVCTQIGCEPTHLIGCTGYEGCIQPTGTPPETVCPQGDADAQALGHTAYPGCGQHGTEATVCTQIGCDGTLGHTAYEGCGQNGTEATVCTQIGCGPTHLIGCTGYEGCHQGTAATVCTQVGCDGGNAQAQIQSIPVANCIPTRSCTGAWPVC